MASTVDFDRITEYNEKDEATLNAKIDQLTEYVRKSRYTVFYTGAGVSTSAGVPDYRGPTGCWTMKALGKKAESRVSMMEAQPTPSHMAQATLINRGIAHYVVTTNLDGLYRKSGLKAHEQVCNLHGDVYAERCTGCGYEFERNYHVRNDSIHVHDHRVGKCERCGSAPKRDPKTKEYLRLGTKDKDCGTKDTHINFGEYLDDIEWEESTLHCSKADLVIVAGTSMSLRHITHLPFLAQKKKKDGTKGKVVIINLQETPDDDECDLRIFSKTDIVFEGLMSRLDIPMDPIPVWRPRDAKPIEEIPSYIGSYYREHARKLEDAAKMREEEALQRQMADVSVVDKVPESPSDLAGASSSGPAPPAAASSSSSLSIFRKLFG